MVEKLREDYGAIVARLVENFRRYEGREPTCRERCELEDQALCLEGKPGHGDVIRHRREERDRRRHPFGDYDPEYAFSGHWRPSQARHNSW